MALELRCLHRAMEGSWIGWFPTVAAGIGLAAALIALLRPLAAQRAAIGLFLVCSLGGLLGFHYHVKRNPDWFVELLTGQAPVTADAQTSARTTPVPEPFVSAGPTPPRSPRSPSPACALSAPPLAGPKKPDGPDGPSCAGEEGTGDRRTAPSRRRSAIAPGSPATGPKPYRRRKPRSLGPFHQTRFSRRCSQTPRNRGHGWPTWLGGAALSTAPPLMELTTCSYRRRRKNTPLIPIAKAIAAREVGSGTHSVAT